MLRSDDRDLDREPAVSTPDPKLIRAAPPVISARLPDTVRKQRVPMIRGENNAGLWRRWFEYNQVQACNSDVWPLKLPRTVHYN